MGIIILAVFVVIGVLVYKNYGKKQASNPTGKTQPAAPLAPPDGSKPQYSFFMYSGSVSDLQYINVNGRDGKVLHTEMKFFVVGDMALPFRFPVSQLALIDGWTVAIVQATNLNTKQKLPVRLFVTSHQVWDDLDQNMQEVVKGAFGGVPRLQEEMAQYGLNQKLLASSVRYSPAG